MVRTPIVSIEKYLEFFNQQEITLSSLIELFSSPLFKEILSIASEDLSKSLEQIDVNMRSKKLTQIESSLLKYFIRLSTRPTPFGLFSGISIGKFSDITDIKVSSVSKHIKKARPDMEWVYGFIKLLESDNEFKEQLHTRFNEFTFANGNRLVKPSGTFLEHSENEKQTNSHLSSIRYTKQVRSVETMS